MLVRRWFLVVVGGLKLLSGVDVPLCPICVVPDAPLRRQCLFLNPSVWRVFSMFSDPPSNPQSPDKFDPQSRSNKQCTHGNQSFINMMFINYICVYVLFISSFIVKSAPFKPNQSLPLGCLMEIKLLMMVCSSSFMKFSITAADVCSVL